MKSRMNSILMCLLIGLCFLWTGTGYMTWMYRLMVFYPAASVDILTEVVGYFFQAMGLVCVSICMKKNLLAHKDKFFSLLMLLDLVFIILSVLATNGGSALFFGYCINLCHGIVAGLYLTKLVLHVNQQQRGVVFGLGYGLGSIGSYVISLIGDNNFLKSNYVLIVYTVLVILTIVVLTFIGKSATTPTIPTPRESGLNNRIILLALFTVLLLCFVKGLGFYFPSSDLSNISFKFELSRVFYAFSLIIAGIINDKNRKWGGVCCIATLVIPFVILALKNNVESSFVLWILSYLLFGFFSVYRVIIFTDIASKSDEYLFLAGLGLMVGRLGDAISALIGVELSANPIALILIATVGFMITIFLFINLFNKLYTPTAPAMPSKETLLEDFQKTYQLSPREMEVFKLVIEGHSNTEIADDLFISYNTVKFHFKNLYKKTNCSSRSELVELFRAGK